MTTVRISRRRGLLVLPALFGALILSMQFTWLPPAKGETPQAATAFASNTADRAEVPLARRARIIVRGYFFENDKPRSIGIAAIDLETGGWKKLQVSNRGGFAVSPDGETIVFENDGTLWNGDTTANANPGRVFGEYGHVVFSPDVEQDLQIGKNNQPVVTADAKGSRMRIAIIDLVTGNSSDLKIQQQDGWDFYPTGHLEWR